MAQLRTHIGREIAGTRRAGFRAARRVRPSRKRSLWIPFLLAAASFFIYVFLFGDRGFLRERQVRREIAGLEEEIEVLEWEGEQLKAVITELETRGPEFERIGREQIGLIKPGEISYRLVPAAKDGWVIDTGTGDR